MSREQAIWVDWRTIRLANFPAQRVYFGHETCWHLLPPARMASEWARPANDHGTKLTLVTPFLSNEGLDETRRLIDDLLAVVQDLGHGYHGHGLVREGTFHARIAHRRHDIEVSLP